MLIVIAIVVRLRLGSPVLFRQMRPGLHERPFMLLKFRTMTDARDANGSLLPDAKRLLPFGCFLRRYSLDELPQFFNVLRGDMSVVGPRPLLLKHLPYFTDAERVRFLVRPGITGLAQVAGRNTVSWDERFRLDIRYVETVNFRLDVTILLQTVRLLLARKGVVVDPESTMRNLDEERSAPLAASTTGGRDD